MQIFSIEASSNSPKILIDGNHGVLEISGISTLKQAGDFYRQVERWIRAFNLTDPSTQTVNIMLDEIDGRSAYWMLHILQQLEGLYQTGNRNLVVNWYYNAGNRKMLMAGKEYRMNVRLPFNIVAA